MGLIGSRSELIYLVGTDYEDQIGYRFTFVHKSILIVLQDCIRVSGQGIWIRLTD